MRKRLWSTAAIPVLGGCGRQAASMQVKQRVVQALEQAAKR